MVETGGNAPTATILQGSSAPLCCPHGAEGWFRANLPASSARCFHQISFLGVKAFASVLSVKLVRASVIETESPEWRSGARPSSYVRILTKTGEGALSVGSTEWNLVPEGTAFNHPLAFALTPCESANDALCVADRVFGRTTWPRRDERA